ncbi:hypothetical protein Aoki45_37740 [Algoriphagus sp. oki45]|uniref:hypothetical protein n=1 Tax=Algoriphagus sp. oki45 TaxID=3067294 RepID=UPI0027F2F94B|nr:hypothetical protein Aoki45_37740 [Algoriphagus sp. oki45]
MKRSIFIMLSLILAIFSCIDQEQKTSLESLESLEAEIIALSESVSCTNADQWKFFPMGSKACGGPERYIAYHQSVENSILPLIDKYTLQQAEYNRANNIVSDCLLVGSPRGVTCENGKPVLFY